MPSKLGMWEFCSPIKFPIFFFFFLQGRLPRCSMSSALPSLTVPVILRNLCPSDKKGSGLGSVVTTLSRSLHVDIRWNIFSITLRIPCLSFPSVPFPNHLPSLVLCPVPEHLTPCLPPHCAHRHDWLSEDDVLTWVSPLSDRSQPRSPLYIYKPTLISQLSSHTPSLPPCLSTILRSLFWLLSCQTSLTSLHPAPMHRVSGSKNVTSLP